MTTTQIQTRTRAARRGELGLLIGLAVTLGSVAAPLADTAHAGSKPGVLSGCSFPPPYRCSTD